MVQDNKNVSINLTPKIDEQGQQRALQAIEQSKRALDSMRESNKVSTQVYEDANRASQRYSDSLDSVKKSAVDAARATQRSDMGLDALRRAAIAAGDYNDTLENTERRIRSVAEANERFNTVSQRVALGGDVESGLNTIRGAGEAFGLGEGGSRALGVGAEFFAVVEAAPRLKEAFAGMPATISAAATALGPMGIAVGLAAVAAAALTQNTLAAVAAQNEYIRTNFEARDSVQELIASGVTSAEAEEILRQRRDEEAQAIRNQAEAVRLGSQAFDEAASQFGVFGDLIVSGSMAVTGVGNEFGAAAERYGTQAQELGVQANALDAALNAGAFAANDAAEAERSLTAARTAGVLQAAQDERSLFIAQQRALHSSAEANEQRLAEIERQTEAAARQRRVLIESGDTSEQVTRQIETLNAEIGSLGREAEFIRNRALPDARMMEAQQRRIEAANQAETERTQRAQESAQARADLEQQTADKIIDIARQTAKAQEEAVRRLEEAQQDAATKRRFDENEAAIEAGIEKQNLLISFQREEAAAYREHLDELIDIRKEAARAEEDALLDLDFRRVFEIRRDTVRQMQDAATGFGRGRREAGIGLGEEQQDLERSIQQERDTRLRAYEQQLADLNVRFQRESELIRQREREQGQALQRDYAMAQAALQAQSQLEQSASQARILIANTFAQDVVAIERQTAAARLSALVGSSSKFGGGGFSGSQFRDDGFRRTGGRTSVDNSRSLSVQLSQTINSNNGREVARIARNEINRFAEELLK